MYTDSHCHLNFPQLQSRMSEIRQDMQTAQVSRALLISTQLETFEDVHGLAMAYDNFWCTAGVHPDEDQVQEPTLDDLLRIGQRSKVVGIGETGLDYYRLATVQWLTWNGNASASGCIYGRPGNWICRWSYIPAVPAQTPWRY